MSIYIKFNEVRDGKVLSEPSALRIDSLAAIRQWPAHTIVQFTEIIAREQNLVARISDQKLADTPEQMAAAVAAAPPRLVDTYGFVAVEGMSDKCVVTATDRFRLITPANNDGTCSHITFEAGYKLPSSMSDGVKSIDLKTKTSDVIARMEQRGHVFIDLTAKP